MCTCETGFLISECSKRIRVTWLPQPGSVLHAFRLGGFKRRHRHTGLAGRNLIESKIWFWEMQFLFQRFLKPWCKPRQGTLSSSRPGNCWLLDRRCCRWHTGRRCGCGLRQLSRCTKAPRLPQGSHSCRTAFPCIWKARLKQGSFIRPWITFITWMEIDTLIHLWLCIR